MILLYLYLLLNHRILLKYLKACLNIIFFILIIDKSKNYFKNSSSDINSLTSTFS